jgi:hypothetical protein
LSKLTIAEPEPASARTEFATGAFRDGDADKIDFEAHISPLSLELVARYMHKHRILPDGSRRAGDNWQKGIPEESFRKSLIRHVMDLWKLWRGWPAREPEEDAIGGALFNLLGLAHEFELKRIAAAGNPDTDTVRAKPAA